MITLPFATLPGASQLFVDYCAGLPEARRYFVGHFSDLMAYETHLGLLEQRVYAREKLVPILQRHHRTFGGGEQTARAIERLKDPMTMAVMTGQQVGLFTGPLYTLYKAFTTIHLARWMQEQFPSYTFLPMFWLEMEDHDLDEANAAVVLGRNAELAHHSYGLEFEPGVKNTQPVGSIVFDERISATITELMGSMGPSEFSEELETLLRTTYESGTSFGTAFARLFQRLLPESGLIFVDTSDPDLKQLAGPVFTTELETYPAAGEEIIKRSAELEERYHAQVKSRAVNLFLLHKDGRYAIEPTEDAFFLRGTRQRFTKEELLAMAYHQPERFSPNVILRPIVQDMIFPTAAYVAGPGEIAYFAQLQPVYDHFDVPMPIIFPRASITVLEPRIRRIFEKYDFPLAAMVATTDTIFSLALRRAQQESSVQEFFALKTALVGQARQLAEILSPIHPNLASPATTAIEKVEHQLGLLEQRLIDTMKQEDGTMRTHIERLKRYCMPEDTLQERVLNISLFLNRFGPDIVRTLFDQCQPFPAEHRIVFPQDSRLS